MIALFIFALVGTALILGALPFVAYALMLETAAQRVQAANGAAAMISTSDDEEEAPPSSLRPQFGFAG